jgi:diguanylate cyclase (GGDEF)-like protein
VLGSLAAGIVLTQQASRSRLLANLGLRGTTSASFVSTYLSQQASREQAAARQFMSGAHVSPERFHIVTAAFGSDAAVLLDSAGRLLDVVPSDRALIGKPIAAHYSHLTRAEHGSVAISNVVPSAVKRAAVAAIAVPFSTPQGRRVFSAGYAVAGSTLGAFVAHTISYPQHRVYLVDSSGHLLAASPTTNAATIGQADSALARAITRASRGPLTGAKTPSTFTTAPVPGTSWRIVIAVPDSRLYASIEGWAGLVPWLIFALVSVLGALLALLLARLSALSHKLAHSARTDSLTGLPNRRALTEHLARAAARARRRGEPMSVLMIDLDHFKQVNDTFGHAAGDKVLRAVAECLRDVLRAEDVYGRWGGDEFVVLMPHGDEEEARIVGDRLRAAAAEADVNDTGLPAAIQLCVGAATATHVSPDEIVHRADLALYQAKNARNGAVRSVA